MIKHTCYIFIIMLVFMGLIFGQAMKNENKFNTSSELALFLDNTFSESIDFQCDRYHNITLQDTPQEYGYSTCTIIDHATRISLEATKISAVYAYDTRSDENYIAWFYFTLVCICIWPVLVLWKPLLMLIYAIWLMIKHLFILIKKLFHKKEEE